MKKKYYKDLKVGDKVRVKKHLKVGEVYKRIFFTGEMEELCGKKVTVRRIDKNDLSIGIEETRHYFSRGMLKNPKEDRCAPSFAEILFGDNHSVEKTPEGYTHTWVFEKPPIKIPSPITETKKGYRYYTKLRDKINEILAYLEEIPTSQGDN